MVVMLTSAFLLAGCAVPKGSNVAEKREYIQQMRQETLTKLFQEKPHTRGVVKSAAGYAVFSNINTNLFLFSTAQGYGVVKDNATGKYTYMKMGQVGVGPGLGIKDFRAVIVFKSKKVMRDFVEKGWEFGGHADAAAKSGEKGGSAGAEAYVAKDILIYTMTEAGAALQATVAGTKYWQDDELN
jgi:lipid-binding SYLF domain-containing protein